MIGPGRRRPAAPAVALLLHQLGDLEDVAQSFVFDDGALVDHSHAVVGTNLQRGAVGPDLDPAIRVLVADPLA